MCGDSVCAGLVQFVAGAVTNSKGELIPESNVAPRFRSLLRNTRKTAKGDPLGVLVSFDVELLGLRNKEILLRWSIWKASGQGRLFGAWVSSNVAYRLKASAEDDATPLDIWVPLPKVGGSFVVELILTTDGERLARRKTPRFS